MTRTLTAAVHREEDVYVSRCLELEVASQGDSIEQAMANLTEAVELYLSETGAAEPEQTPLVTPFQVDAA